MKKPIAFLDANLYNNRKYLVSYATESLKRKFIKWGKYRCTVISVMMKKC
jgi:hypothetical protein